MTVTSLWNYNPSNHPVLGDDWNGENFSWYSDEKIKDKLYERFLGDQEFKGDMTVEGKELDIGGSLLREIVVSVLPLRNVVLPRILIIPTRLIPHILE